jgi:hypothetical protein
MGACWWLEESEHTVTVNMFHLKSSIFCDIMPCSLLKLTDILEEQVTSTFMVKE